MAEDTLTKPSERSNDRWDRVLQIVSLGLVTGLILGAVLGLIGPRHQTAAVKGQGILLQVTYAAVTRAGLATSLEIEVSTTDGEPLPRLITVRLDRSYLGLFDQHGFEPTPAWSHQSATRIWWTFEVPPGHLELRMSLDARLQPDAHWGQRSTAAVEVDGDEVVALSFRTLVMP
jgi:hypothetical protein